MTNPPLHPICRLFPMLPEAELEGMAEDIRRRGKLLEPIVLLKGAVLDGQNRLEACRRAGVPPTFITWEGEGSPLEWAIAKNIHRRQLTASQRAVIALQVLPLLEQEAKERQRVYATPDRRVAQFCANPPQEGEDERGKAAEHAARLLGASPRYIQAAKRIDGMCPDLLPHVMLGKRVRKCLQGACGRVIMDGLFRPAAEGVPFPAGWRFSPPSKRRNLLSSFYSSFSFWASAFWQDPGRV